MPIALRGPRKAVRGKCERGRGSVNADGAGAKVFAGDGYSQGRLSAPWLRFHGADRADVYIIIHVRACCCGECALNPPTAQPIPRRRPSLAPAQRHALPEHFRSPTQPRRTPAGCAMHARRPHNPFPAEDLRSSTHSDTPFPSTSAPPRSADSHPQAARCIPRRPHNPFPAEGLRSPPHSDTPFPSTSAPPRSPDTRPLTSQPIPRRRPSPAPAQRRALPEHFLTPFPHTSTPHAATMHAHRPHNPFPAEGRRPPPHSDAPFPSTSAPPRSPDARPQAAPCIPRRPHDPFPAEELRPSPQRHAASPSVPLWAQKNGTAQCMCDAECLGRPSLRSVIGVGEPRAVRRRCGALAWRVGLRPQPWALRSRRCGRVLRA